MGKISDLPLCIIEIILSFLPYQDVVKTSILSKEWRYHWTKIPKIAVIVDTSQAPPLKRRRSEQRQVMIRKSLFHICQTMSMHECPIHEFNLYLKDEAENVDEIDSIITLLSRKNTVKKMILDLDGMWYHNSIPLSSLLSMSQLTYLYVKGWNLRSEPASSWPKHGSLTSLYVHHSCFYVETLLDLLSRCPLLKTLDLTDNLIIDITGSAANLTNLFGSLPVIEKLTFCSRFIKPLPLGNLPEEVPATLVHLKHLCIENIYFSRYNELHGMSLIMKSSPNLEKLTVKFIDVERHGEIMTFSYTIKEYTDIWMEHLSELEFTYISSEQTEMDFVKRILMRSPVLKKLKIFISKSYKDAEMQISKTLLSAPCASPGVELIVEKEPF